MAIKIKKKKDLYRWLRRRKRGNFATKQQLEKLKERFERITNAN